MSDTLRDQLLNLGFKASTPKPDRPRPNHKGGPQGRDRGPQPGRRADGDRRPPKGQPRPQGQRAPRSREEIDLAKAYALRAQKEKDERIAAEAARQEEARLRREARARLAVFLQGKALNVADAEIARHFPYGGKIKRVYVTPDQLRALNAGELGVVQHEGRYVLLTAAHLAEAEAIFPQAVALKVDPDAPAGDDPYGDPRYQVPDDLVW